jgi:hypothetical protein
LDLTGERRRNRGLCFRKTYTSISLLQSSTIVCAIAAHANLNFHGRLQKFDKVGLVIGRHSGIDLGLHQHFSQRYFILLPILVQVSQSFSVQGNAELVFIF